MRTTNTPYVKNKKDNYMNYDRDLPKMNNRISETVSDDFDSDTLFTFKYSITG